MIVSHQYKFVLITPPKTGSTSLHTFLSQQPFCERPWEPVPDSQHSAEIPAGCEDYDIITCWRHPLDREVSLWGHSQSSESLRVDEHGPFSFDHFVREWQPNATPFYRDSQTTWLAGIRPTIVLRFSHMAADLMQCRPVKDAITAGRRLKPIQALNRSQHPHWRRCYTPELREIVLQRFAGDLALPLTGDPL